MIESYFTNKKNTLNEGQKDLENKKVEFTLQQQEEKEKLIKDERDYYKGKYETEKVLNSELYKECNDLKIELKKQVDEYKNLLIDYEKEIKIIHSKTVLSRGNKNIDQDIEREL